MSKFTSISGAVLQSYLIMRLPSGLNMAYVSPSGRNCMSGAEYDGWLPGYTQSDSSMADDSESMADTIMHPAIAV